MDETRIQKPHKGDPDVGYRSHGRRRRITVEDALQRTHRRIERK